MHSSLLKKHFTGFCIVIILIIPIYFMVKYYPYPRWMIRGIGSWLLAPFVSFLISFLFVLTQVIRYLVSRKQNNRFIIVGGINTVLFLIFLWIATNGGAFLLDRENWKGTYLLLYTPAIFNLYYWIRVLTGKR